MNCHSGKLSLRHAEALAVAGRKKVYLERSRPIGKSGTCGCANEMLGSRFAPHGITLLIMLSCFLSSQALANSPSVDPALCRALVEHVPDADVAYEPGIDVHGKPVAPADLPDQPRLQLPDQIKIPLTLGLAKTLNLNTSAYPYNKLGSGTEVQLGVLTVEGRRVLFDGQPISDEQQERLAVLCLQPR